MRSIILALVAATVLPARAEIKLEQEDGRLRIAIDGDLFTEYRTDGHVPCLSPLVSPSGAGLTRSFPLTDAAPGEAKDHPHHRSFWTTHGSVNGIDFWALPKDPGTRIAHQKFGETTTGTATHAGQTIDRARFTVNLAWIADGATHLTEQRTYTVTATGRTRTVDVTSVLTAADRDVLFGDTKEGTFSVRLAPTLRLKGQVAKGHSLNSEGHRDNDCWGKRARWVSYHGPDAKDEPAVVVIMDHPKNLRHPTWWHARNYGLVAANPFGRHDFEGKKNEPHLGDHTLGKGESLTFTHRFVLHHGTLESAKIEEAWKRFAKSGQANH